MVNTYKIVCEALQSKNVPFVLHQHNSRSGSLHFDLRFLDPFNPKLLHSFALPSNFLEKINTKSIAVKTRDHDPRWLELKSYRLKDIDKGMITLKIATYKYFELEFHGKILTGSYKLFKMSNTRRDDMWLLAKEG